MRISENNLCKLGTCGIEAIVDRAGACITVHALPYATAKNFGACIANKVYISFIDTSTKAIQHTWSRTALGS
jgi:hypothetical protein